MIKIKTKAEPAFTIVELLIVIVVISILALITLTTYRGLQSRAQEAVVSSDLSQASKQLAIDKAYTGNYPASPGAADGGNGLRFSSGTSYQYTVNNAATPPTYCLTGINGAQGYRVTQLGIPEVGICAGHTGPGSGSGSICSTLAVGAAGLAGGIIFYKDTSVTPNVCYEAAPAGWYAATAPNDPGAEWGCYNKNITGADGTAIGTGRQNTIDMKAAACSPYTAGNLIAATIASNYIGGGKSDWFIPSKDELNEMYLQRNAIGGFTSVYYWASSEYSATDAYRHYFSNGVMGNVLKLNTNRIRPIRSFSD